MPQDKDALGQVSRILAGLGQTPERLAEVLREAGCRGFQHGSFPSPVIRYVYRRFDEGALDLIYSDWKPESLRLSRPDGRWEELPLPAAVAEFLALFDQGAYPDLDLEARARSA